MRVWITKDYWDGTRSKAKLVDLDGLPMSQFLFMMMERGVAGFTVTHKTSVSRMLEQASGAERGSLAPEKPDED